MLPLILVGAAVLFGGAGVKKVAEGASDATRAVGIAEEASIRQKAAQDRLDRAVRQAERSFDRLEAMRAKARTVLTDEVAPTLRRVAGVDDQGFSSFKDALARPDRLAVAFGVRQGGIPSAAMGAFKGFGAGVALTGAAQGAVGTFAAASTGASISGLSGVAASNATLAWFGGGSLASGGLGIAGGTAVLGGLVAAPVVLLAGLAYANRAQEQLTEATSYAEDVSVSIERSMGVERRIAAIRRRVGEVHKAVLDLVRRTRSIVDVLNAAFDELPAERRAFGSLGRAEQDRTLLLGVLAELLGELVEVAIMDEAAELLDDSAAVLDRARSLDVLGVA